MASALSQFTRRDFIHQLAFCYAALQLPISFTGCGPKETSFTGKGKPPYKVWEEMLKALENSPDHLSARMKQLIESKDPKAMFDFVREEITLMPSEPNSLRNSGTQLKWGIDGILRYGMATPREKAELLHKMFTEAEIPSRIVFERTNFEPEEVVSFFCKPVERAFDLKIPPRQIKEWQEQLGIETETKGQLQYFDEALEKTHTLAEQLWQLIPEKEMLNKRPFDLRWDNYRTPTLQFEWEGQTKYAHLFDTKVPFGALKNGGNVKEAEAEKVYEEKVHISIKYRDSIQTDQEKELVTGTWLSRELIGGQLRLAFLHGLSLEQQTYTPVGSLRIFTPTLAYQHFDKTLPFLEERSFAGDPFTLEGKRIELSDESDKIDEQVILKSTDPDLVKKVKTLIFNTIPVAYPFLKLQITPRDSQGEMVEGLSAADFVITDNQIPNGALMEANRRTPKILVLHDTSFSMPKEYLAEGMEAFKEGLYREIKEIFPAAIITSWETPSAIFTWLLKASKTDYDLIIYTTDGDNDDQFNPEDENGYKNGPPAIVLNVYNSVEPHRMKTFNKMVALTGGVLLNAKDQQVAINAVSKYVSGMEIPPYVFTCYAPGETEHTVKVQLDKGRVANTDTFSWPDKREHVSQMIIGLYMDLSIGKNHIRRVLAGWDPAIDRKKVPGKEQFNDVKQLIFGGATLYFEGEGPTIASSLSDVLKYKLSTRNWGEAMLENDLEKAKKAFAQGGFIFHQNIIPLMAPLENAINEESYTFASGMRIAVLKNKVGIESQSSTLSFDYLPTSGYISFSGKTDNAFKINLEKTSQMAIREAFLFQTSSYGLLFDKGLLERAEALKQKWPGPNKIPEVEKVFWEEKILRGDQTFKLFDPTASVKAFWQINATTGELYGLLEDGTGGGGKSIETQIKELEMVIDIYMEVIDLIDKGSPALSVIAIYGVTLMKLYGIVCETLMVMDTTGMDEKIKAALQEFACEVAKELTFSFLTKKVKDLEKPMPGLEQMIGLMGSDSGPFQC